MLNNKRHLKCGCRLRSSVDRNGGKRNKWRLLCKEHRKYCDAPKYYYLKGGWGLKKK